MYDPLCMAPALVWSRLVPHCGLQCSVLIGLGADVLCDLNPAEHLFVPDEETIIPLKLQWSQSPEPTSKAQITFTVS